MSQKMYTCEVRILHKYTKIKSYTNIILFKFMFNVSVFILQEKSSGTLFEF